jgi:hypothetical protein
LAAPINHRACSAGKRRGKKLEVFVPGDQFQVNKKKFPVRASFNGENLLSFPSVEAIEIDNAQ